MEFMKKKHISKFTIILTVYNCKKYFLANRKISRTYLGGGGNKYVFAATKRIWTGFNKKASIESAAKHGIEDKFCYKTLPRISHNFGLGPLCPR